MIETKFKKRMFAPKFKIRTKHVSFYLRGSPSFFFSLVCVLPLQWPGQNDLPD